MRNLLTSLITATTILSSFVPASIITSQSPAQATSSFSVVQQLPVQWRVCD